MRSTVFFENNYMNTSRFYLVESGFTLLELLIVVAILGVLAGIGIPQYSGYQSQAKSNGTKTQFSTMVNLIGNELTKCSAGAANILETSPQSTSCNSDNATLQSAFINYGNATGKNPYDVNSPVYISIGTALDGQILITADPGNVGKFTLTGTYQSSGTPTLLGPNLINRE